MAPQTTMKLFAAATLQPKHASRNAGSKAVSPVIATKKHDATMSLLPPEHDREREYTIGQIVFMQHDFSHRNLAQIGSIELQQDLSVTVVYALPKDSEPLTADQLQDARMISQLLSALKYLHERGVTHGHLALNSIHYSPQLTRLFIVDYWRYSMSDYQSTLQLYWSPERVLSQVGIFTDDIWALGVMLYEVLTGQSLFSGVNDMMDVLLLIQDAQVVVDERMSKLTGDPMLIDIVRRCLVVELAKRAGIQELAGMLQSTQSSIDRRNLLDDARTLFDMWRMASGRLESNDSKVPTILQMPVAIQIQADLKHHRVQGIELGASIGLLQKSSAETRELPMDRLNARLETHDYNIVMLPVPPFDEDAEASVTIGDTPVKLPLLTNLKYPRKLELPVKLRNQDVKYQCELMECFGVLLHGLPFTKRQLDFCIANCDMPVSMYSLMWAYQLGVKSAPKMIFSDDDKEVEVDRQLDLDLPRCHPYHEVIGTQLGRHRVRKLLKQWLATNDGLVYWQGLDSVCAPFVVVTHQQQGDALAYTMFRQFISEYLHDFFRADNSALLNSHLHLLRQLLLYHDPQLCMHLHDIQFTCDLFAIPWLLTLFAHTMPLEATIQLWTLMFQSSSCHRKTIAAHLSLAMLTSQSIRRHLMQAHDFMECQQHVSGHQLAQLDMEQVFQQVLAFQLSVPRSLIAKLDGGLPRHITERDPIPSVIADDVCNFGVGEVVLIDARPLADYQSNHQRGAVHSSQFQHEGTTVSVVVTVSQDNNRFKFARTLAEVHLVSRVSLLANADHQCQCGGAGGKCTVQDQ